MPKLAILAVKVISKSIYLQKLPKKSQHVCPTARRCSLRLLVCIVFTLEITVAQFHWNWVFIRSFKTCPRTEGGQNSNYEGEISKVLLLATYQWRKKSHTEEKKIVQFNLSTKKYKVIKPITSNCLKNLIIEMRSPFLLLSFYFPLFSTFFSWSKGFPWWGRRCGNRGNMSLGKLGISD